MYALSRRNIFDKKQYILSVYLINNKFKLAGETENTTCYPNDIDYAYETVVFINGKTLTIKSLINNIEVSTDFENKLIIARFIPETKDILLFDRNINFFGEKRQVYLLKCNDFNKLSYCINDTKKLNVTVENAYFDANDKNNLRIIVKRHDKFLFLMLSTVPGTIGATIVVFPVLYYLDSLVKNNIISEAIGCYIAGPSTILLDFLCLNLGNAAKEIYNINHTKKLTLQPEGSKLKLDNLPWEIKK